MFLTMRKISDDIWGALSIVPFGGEGGTEEGRDGGEGGKGRAEGRGGRGEGVVNKALRSTLFVFFVYQTGWLLEGREWVFCLITKGAACFVFLRGEGGAVICEG